VERGWLSADDRADVERLLQRKLRKQRGHSAAGDSPSWLPGTSPTDPSTTQIVSSSPTLVAGTTAPLATSLRTSGYEKKRVHATGGMGQIWQAHDPDLDREVAIKELRSELSDDPRTRERFVREARLMGQLTHPGIVPIHVVGEDERGTPYYVMKFVHGRTLEEAITAYHEKPTASGFRDLLRHFGDVCQTISFAHTQGVIHRDLKPKNIMLGNFGETFLLDWGLAKRLEPDGMMVLDLPAADRGLTQAGQILGTPAYMSPEQTTGHPGGLLTDIYALGVILYEILVGRSPYQGTDTLELLLQVRNGQVTAPSEIRDDIPRGLEAVCLKAMAARPGERYQSAADLAEAVENWLADELVRSEAALRESEQRWRSLTEALPQLVWSATPDGACDYFSTQWTEHTGIPEAELLGWRWLQTLHPEDREPTRQVWLGAAAGHHPYDVEYRVRRREGAYRWFKTRGVPIRDGSGNIVKWFGSCTDITDLRQTEEALRASEERWRSLTEALPQLVWSATPDGACDYFSSQWTEHTGVPEGELLGWRWLKTLHPEDREPTRQVWLGAAAGRHPYDVEYRVRRRDGEYRWFKTRGAPIRDGSGHIVKWFGTCTDITDLRQTENARGPKRGGASPVAGIPGGDYVGG
jgi:PAS domain S-box-containing protein